MASSHHFKPCLSSATKRRTPNATPSDSSSSSRPVLVRDRHEAAGTRRLPPQLSRGKRLGHPRGSSKRKHAQLNPKPQICWKTFKERQNNHEFDRGNYHGYYLYRNVGLEEHSDYRVALINQIPAPVQKKMANCDRWVDVGSNAGDLTIILTLMFRPHRMYGIELDKELAQQAQDNVVKLATAYRGSLYRVGNAGIEFIVSGEVSEASDQQLLAVDESILQSMQFINLEFDQFFDSLTESDHGMFDVISCFSVIKWIHVYGGDAGLMNFFRRCKTLLKDGGVFLFEYQEWESYMKKENLNEVVKNNLSNIQIKPAYFVNTLEQLGFSLAFSGTFDGISKGFRRNFAVLCNMKTNST